MALSFANRSHESERIRSKKEHKRKELLSLAANAACFKLRGFVKKVVFNDASLSFISDSFEIPLKDSLTLTANFIPIPSTGVDAKLSEAD